MNKYRSSFLLAILLGLFSAAQAGELGRLFNSPQERKQLEYQDAGSNSSGEEGGRHNYIVVNGVVQKHGGNRTIWINGKAQAAGQANEKTPASVPIAVPGKSQSVQLKVGQRLLLEAPAPEEQK